VSMYTTTCTQQYHTPYTAAASAASGWPNGRRGTLIWRTWLIVRERFETWGWDEFASYWKPPGNTFGTSDGVQRPREP